ncbi:MAG: L-threonylcarbamoyladenylate synthase [Anaerolineae bacterium]
MRSTRVLVVRADEPEPEIIAIAAEAIREGKLVAFPTETVYGLGADAFNPEAVVEIFRAKGRPAHDPLIVHVASGAELQRVARHIPDVACQLAERFWPGPLTLVLPKAESVPSVVTAGGDTVAVRCPSHPVALALLRAAATPIAAPSANRFGHTSPTTAEHVLDDLQGRIDLILDGGPTWVGVESTVLDLTGEVPAILRPGGTTREALESVLGPVQIVERVKSTSAAPLPSPGMMERHYAPHTPLWLFVGPAALVREALLKQARELTSLGKRVGLLIAEDDGPAFAGELVVREEVGSAADLETVAKNLYPALRRLDALGLDVILARDFGVQGLGLAIRDRLIRAADRVIPIAHE